MNIKYNVFLVLLIKQKMLVVAFCFNKVVLLWKNVKLNMDIIQI
jgi:hypothetical protein